MKYLTLLLVLLLASTAHAVRIADVTRLGGQRTNVLTGMGLVYGLPNTGDGGQFQPAIRPLKQMLAAFQNKTTELELAGAGNVALVSLTVTVPRNGARAGDALDVYVTSIGAASSLRGGRLFVTPLQGPIPVAGKPEAANIFALANGALLIEDPTTPTVGVVKGGAVMEQDLILPQVDRFGQFQLIIDDPSASWAMANTIATMVNDAEGAAVADAPDGAPLAVAATANTVVVTLPQAERANPAAFVARVQALPLPEVFAEARVQINDATGTLIITGDVEISPVVISHKGLTITTVTPAPPPNPLAPAIETHEIVALDPQQRGGAKLKDLVDALDKLKVPAADRIAIVKLLHESGKLHAKVFVNGRPM